MPMPERYIIEMFCDRVAASKNYNRDSYNDSFPLAYYTKNKDHYVLHPHTRKLIEKLLNMLAEKGEEHGVQGLLDEQYVDLSTQIHSDIDIELLKRTPSAFLGSCRYKLPEIHENPEIYEKLFEIMDKLDIETFIYIGGNDSMDTIKKLSDYAIVKGHSQKFLGVPKTIDNDLALTDHTPGFGSAAKYIAASTKEIIRDALGLTYNKEMITIIEVMGRNAGWLTGATALAKTEECEGPDAIYLPESVFDIDKFLQTVKNLLEKKKSIVIAVSEGIKLADGRYVCELSGGGEYVDAFGHKQLQGTAAYLASFLGAEIGCKTRSVEFSTLQRSASHMASRVDIDEAFMVGGAAVKAADEGDTGKMVVIDRISDDPYQSAAGIYDVHRIANHEKVVPSTWMNKEGNYVTDEFINYIEPLIQGDYQPFMVNGLPQHLVLRKG